MWPPWRTPPPSPPSCSTETLFSAQRGARQPSGARLVAPRRRPPELGPSPPPIATAATSSTPSRTSGKQTRVLLQSQSASGRRASSRPRRGSGYSRTWPARPGKGPPPAPPPPARHHPSAPAPRTGRAGLGLPQCGRWPGGGGALHPARLLRCPRLHPRARPRPPRRRKPPPLPTLWPCCRAAGPAAGRTKGRLPLLPLWPAQARSWRSPTPLGTGATGCAQRAAPSVSPAGKPRCGGPAASPLHPPPKRVTPWPSTPITATGPLLCVATSRGTRARANAPFLGRLAASLRRSSDGPRRKRCRPCELRNGSYGRHLVCQRRGMRDDAKGCVFAQRRALRPGA